MFNFFKKKKKANDAENTEGKEAKKDTKKFDDIEIHSMPKKFKKASGGSNQTKTLGLLIIIGGGVVLVVASVFLFWYIYNSGGDKKVTQPKDNAPSKVTENKIEDEEKKPDEEKEEELEVIVEKGCGSSSIISVTSTDIEDFNYENEIVLTCLGERVVDDCKKATSTLNILNIGEVQFSILGKRQSKCVAKVTYPTAISEEEFSIYSNSSIQCFYDVNELDNLGYEPAKLAYYIYQQSGLKSLSEESSHCLGTTIDLWRQKQEQAEQEDEEQISNFKSGIDSDNDGLTDVEENTVFVTDSGKTDTDADGYSDYSEVLNLYNPAGSGQLIDSGLVLRYSNSSNNYSVLYPKDWQLEEKVDSIFFSSGIEGSIQILVQANSENKTLSDWYKSLTGDAEISQNNTEETKNDFQVIYSVDKLTAYLAPIGSSGKIFILTYSPENSVSLEFLTILNMMVKSFK